MAVKTTAPIGAAASKPGRAFQQGGTAERHEGGQGQSPSRAGGGKGGQLNHRGGQAERMGGAMAGAVRIAPSDLVVEGVVARRV